MFEKVAPTAEKNIRGCFSITIEGEARAHHVDEIKRTKGDNNGKFAS